MIYYINNFHLLYTCNYNTHINELEQLCQSILDRQPDSMQKLTDLIKDINDITFFKTDCQQPVHEAYPEQSLPLLHLAD